MKKISVIFGTRPEAIKLAPVIQCLKKQEGIDCQICTTAQHRQMLDQVLAVFNLQPDFDLDLMREGQTLAELTARAVSSISDYLESERPDLVIIQGDTTTVFCAALASYYQRIPVAHVEAGLRTNELYSPWPEEGNRLLATRLSHLHFAPTEVAKNNLLGERVPGNSIIVTGNTVIDALFLALEKIKEDETEIAGLPSHVLHSQSPLVLITGHRRENLGKGFEEICSAIRNLSEEFADTQFVYPVHLNPAVRETVTRILKPSGSVVAPNIHLLDPLDYLPFVALMNRSSLVLTDSGGVQEEAPSLGKPVLVMRDTTERPEAVEAGTVRLVGARQDSILAGVRELLNDKDIYESMSKSINPYGDGKASPRIVETCLSYLREV